MDPQFVGAALIAIGTICQKNNIFVGEAVSGEYDAEIAEVMAQHGVDYNDAWKEIETICEPEIICAISE